MNPSELLAARFIAQLLARSRRLDDPAAVVRHLGAMQAQDYHQSLWAVGARTRACTRRDVVAALEKGTVLRTWPMRGTIHLVPAADAQWMVRLSARRTEASSRRRREELGLDDRTVRRAHDLLAEALSGGRRLTRPDVMALWDSHGVATAGQRGYHLLFHAAVLGLTCFGPHEGNQPTFVLLDEWVQKAVRLERGEALAELATRYVTGHGPVTERDFAWWSGLTVTDARAGLRGAGDRLTVTEHHGVRWWTAADAPAAEPLDDVLLLPGFDEYYLGYTDRSHTIESGHADKVVPGRNGVFKPTVVVHGRIVGTWSLSPRSGSPAVALKPFVDGTLDVAKAAPAVRRYMDFLDR